MKILPKYQTDLQPKYTPAGLHDAIKTIFQKAHVLEPAKCEIPTELLARFSHNRALRLQAVTNTLVNNYPIDAVIRGSVKND